MSVCYKVQNLLYSVKFEVQVQNCKEGKLTVLYIILKKQPARVKMSLWNSVSLPGTLTHNHRVVDFHAFMRFFIHRTYAESEWCKKEFREAHAHATGNARNKFLIPILLQDINMQTLDTDLKLYLENHTYIECENMLNIHFLHKISSSNNLQNKLHKYYIFKKLNIASKHCRKR